MGEGRWIKTKNIPDICHFLFAVEQTMNNQKQILEQYLQAKFSDKTPLSITCLDKLTDGWDSDNYQRTVEYGGVIRTRVDWVWRIYSGAGSQAKAMREFNSVESNMGEGTIFFFTLPIRAPVKQ